MGGEVNALKDNEGREGGRGGRNRRKGDEGEVWMQEGARSRSRRRNHCCVCLRTSGSSSSGCLDFFLFKLSLQFQDNSERLKSTGEVWTEVRNKDDGKGFDWLYKLIQMKGSQCWWCVYY